MVKVGVEVLGISGQLLPFWNDDRGLKESVQRLSAKLNEFPLNPALLRGAILWIIYVGV